MKILGLNLKAFEESAGEKGLTLAVKAAQAALNQGEFQVIVFPQMVDLALFCKSLSQNETFRIFAQHCDSASVGSFTGWTSIAAVKSAGASGILLNHSEHKMPHDKLNDLIQACRKEKLVSFVCADSIQEAEKIAKFTPDVIAVEPPELIGKGVSVTTANPRIVKDAVAIMRKLNPSIKVVVGAGVSNEIDVKSALEFGSDGVLLASAFVKSPDAKAFVEKLASLK